MIFWNIIILCVFWVIGIFLYSLGIMQIILSLTCAIPLSKTTVSKCKCYVDTRRLYSSIITAIIFWTVISAFAIFAVLHWGSTYMIIGFLIGIIISFFLSLNKWGITQENYQDYFSSHYKYYAQKDLEDLGILMKSEEGE